MKDNIELLKIKLPTTFSIIDFIWWDKWGMDNYQEDKLKKEILSWFEDYHDQDCCESVSADWSVFDTTINDIFELWTITEISISWVEDMWFVIYFYNWDTSYWEPKRTWIFVPCYNEQNWYYSSNLELIIKIPWTEQIKIDISNYIKDRIF